MKQWTSACNSLLRSLSLMLLTACSSAMQPIPSVAPPPTITPTVDPRPSPTTQAPENIVGNIDIGGRNLYIICVGTGSPTIVMESGWGADSQLWQKIMLEMKDSTRLCAYDRAGLGKSDPAPIPRTGRDMMMDLHALLTEANVPGPYVLVGHSLGGFIIRLYEDEHPEDVIGMVLVDSAHPDQDPSLLAALPPESSNESDCVKDFRSYLTRVVDPKEQTEGLDFEASAAQVRDLGTLGDLPLGVVTAGRGVCDLGPNEPADAAGMDQVWLDLQKELTMLSSNSVQIIAERSGHVIPNDQPEAVIDAIQQVMEMATLR